MKILYVITRAEMGGSQIHLLDLLKGFKDEHQVELAVGEKGFLVEEAAKVDIRCHIESSLVQPIRPSSDCRALLRIYQLIRRTAPDLVHCHTSKAGIVGRAAARLAGVPSVFTAHTWSFAEGTSLRWKLVGVPSERVAARWAERIIAVSESNRNLALERRIVPQSKIVTVWNGVLDTPHRANPGPAAVPGIVMVARFVPQKNQAELLRAVAGLKTRFLLTFVGDGPTRRATEAVAQQLNLGDRVRFAGERRDTDEILARNQLFVLATNWEGFPITIIEAMRAGLPVIATNVDGVREAVLHEETGLIFERGDTALLRSQLNTLLTSPKRRLELGRAGRMRYEARFTREVMLRRTLSVYNDALHVSKQRLGSLARA